MGKVKDNSQVSNLSYRESDNFAMQIGNQRGEINFEKCDAELYMKDATFQVPAKYEDEDIIRR